MENTDGSTGYDDRSHDLSASSAMGSQPEGKENDREEPHRPASKQVPCIRSGNRRAGYPLAHRDRGGCHRAA